MLIAGGLVVGNEAGVADVDGEQVEPAELRASAEDVHDCAGVLALHTQGRLPGGTDDG